GVYLTMSPTIPVPLWLYAAYVVWSLIGGVLSEYPELAQVGLLSTIQFFIMITIFATLCQDIRALWVVTAMIGLAAITNGVAAMFLGLEGIAAEEDRVTGFLHSPNSIGLAFSFGICVFWAGIVAIKRIVWRTIFMICLAILYLGVVRTGSR